MVPGVRPRPGHYSRLQGIEVAQAPGIRPRKIARQEYSMIDYSKKSRRANVCGTALLVIHYNTTNADETVRVKLLSQPTQTKIEIWNAATVKAAVDAAAAGKPPTHVIVKAKSTTWSTDFTVKSNNVLLAANESGRRRQQLRVRIV